MRTALLLALVCVAMLDACVHTCTSSDGARPSDDVRFVAMASSGNVAQLILLKSASVTDGGGTDLTVAPVQSYLGGSMAQSWLDQRSRWADSLNRPMHGTGIGNAPVLPPAIADGAFVAVGGATSVVRFPLTAQDYTDDAAAPVGDAGPSPDPSHLWEFVWPAMPTDDTMLPADDAGAPDPTDDDAGTTTPTMTPAPPTPMLADLVVVPNYPPVPDLAIVARTVVSTAGVISGGETFILNVDDPSHVISLATVSFDDYADVGLHAVAAGFAYQDEVLYAALDHEDFGLMPIYGDGLVAVIDPTMRNVRTVLRFPSLTNCTQIAPYIAPTDSTDTTDLHRLVVTCMGTAPDPIGTPPSDAGFVYLRYDPTQPDRLPSIEQTITNTSLSLPRPDGGVVPLRGHWLAYVSLGSASPAYSDRLIVANLDTNASQTLASAPAANGGTIVGLGHGAFDPGSNVLVVPNGYDGVLTWQLPGDAHTFEATSYVFPDSNAVQVVSCGHLATRTVRVIAGAASVVMPTDAGTTLDAGVANDAANDAASAPDDAGNDAAAATPDAGNDAG